MEKLNLDYIKNAFKNILSDTNLQMRLASASVLAPIVLIFIWLGGTAYNILVLFVAIIMTFEWNNVIRSNLIGDDELNKWGLIGIAYVGIFTSSLIYIRSLPNGLSVTMLMLLMVWATDIAAYFSGRIIGGKKIWPQISPNKTWAGLAGGMCASALVGFFASAFSSTIPAITFMLLGAAVAFMAQVGDFFESWFKRKFGVKDSGGLIPGHGGFMDRLDGFVTVAPIFALSYLVV